MASRPRANQPEPAPRDSSRKRASKKAPVLLAGGNPQVAKADGDAPVQEYIAAMPGWKRELGERLDALIVGVLPEVRKAVRWNSPFYGAGSGAGDGAGGARGEDQGWFLSFHVFTRYVKVTFFAGTSLKPPVPGGTERSGDARWIDLHEGELDERRMTRWIQQAAELPGWKP